MTCLGQCLEGWAAVDLEAGILRLVNMELGNLKHLDQEQRPTPYYNNKS